MYKCNGWIFLSVVMIIIFTSAPVATGNDKVDVRIDIVVIVQYSHTQGARHEMAAYKKLGSYFKFGPESVRFAIVFYTSQVGFSQGDLIEYRPLNWTIMHMSDDPNRYDQTLDDYKIPADLQPTPDRPWKPYKPEEVLSNIRGHIFNDPKASDRARALFYIVTDYAGEFSSFVSKAKELRQAAGVLIYMIVRDTPSGNDVKMAFEATDLEKVFMWRGNIPYDEKLVDEMINVGNAILRDVCDWDSVCRYKDEEKNRCELESWLPSPHPYVQDLKHCEAARPDHECNYVTCEEECDKRWPWETVPPKCGDKCGVKMEGKRRGNAPPRMEYCGHWVECRPCLVNTTTSTTTTTTTTSTPSLTSTTSVVAPDMVSSTGAVISPTTEAGPTPGIPDGPGGKTKTNGEIPIGVIIGGVGGVAFLVLLLAIAIFVTNKKKQQQQQQQSALQKAKLAKSVPPPHVPRKKALMKESAAPQKERFGKEAEVGVGRKFGQAAVTADISMYVRMGSPSAVIAGKAAKSSGDAGKIAKSTVDAGKTAKSSATAGSSKMETKKPKGYRRRQR